MSAAAVSATPSAPRAGSPAITRDEGFTGADLAAGSFEIDIAGTRVPAQVSLKPFFDPERSRVLC